MTWEPYGALYIHVPFCRRRCRYCDFSTRAIESDNPALDEYVDSLVRDIRSASREGLLAQVRTVYLGGGTPSYLGNRRLSQILYTLGVSMHLTPEVECTLEANPESLTPALVRDVYALGVNRLSLGVQSFDDAQLRALGRIHSAEQARRAIEWAHERFDNVSIDLMVGLPDQSEFDVESDVGEAVRLGVSHVSIYPLMVEDSTPLASDVDSGRVVVDEDAGALLMERARELLLSAGFRHYEVASYARPGLESRHNTAYWTGAPYLGLGPGAVTMRQDALVRERLEGTHVVDSLDIFQYTAEDLMLSMRMTRGISDVQLEEAALLLPEAPAALEELVCEGLVSHDAGRWHPTHNGWLFGNRLYGRLLDLAP